MWFDVNIKKLSILLLPTFLRNRKMLALTLAQVTPIASLHDKWKLEREKNIYNLNHNGQVCYLRKVLNDEFDKEQRRIEIIDADLFYWKYIYTYPEEFKFNPTWLGTMYLNQDSDYDNSLDFIVLVPKEIYTESNKYRLVALIEYYKLASKNYKIELK